MEFHCVNYDCSLLLLGLFQGHRKKHGWWFDTSRYRYDSSL